MAISKFGADRRGEVQAVKRALLAEGIDARVSHGRGTAWGWLEVNVGDGQQFGPHRDPDGGEVDSSCPHSRYHCPRCRGRYALQRRAEKIVLEVTGRTGGYIGSGDINIHTQDHWVQKLKKSVPILHPAFVPTQEELDQA